MTPLLVPAPGSPRYWPPKPLLSGVRTPAEHGLVHVFILVPFLALIAAVPLAWGWGLSWLDVELAAGCYTLTGLAVTIGFHRHFTHGAFKANRVLRMTLAAVGIMAVQGSGDRVGRRPPTTPRILGSAGRSAFPMVLRDRSRRTGQGFLARTPGPGSSDKGKTNDDGVRPDLAADRDMQPSMDCSCCGRC